MTTPGTVRAVRPPGADLVLLDGGWPTTREAEHATRTWAVEHGTWITMACTHFHAGRVVVTVTTHDPAPPADDVREPAEAALLRARTARTAGRAFVFPGQDGQPPVTTVADLCATSAVDEVVGLAGVRPDGRAPVRTLSFLRPELADGRLRLRVRPAAGDCLVPFEQPSPTPCCADH